MENKNRLIAEFMGMQKTDIGWYDFEETLNDEYSNTFDGLYFHNSWDWLIPVINKIYESNFDTDQNNLLGDITHAILDLDIERTYEAVVKFLQHFYEH